MKEGRKKGRKDGRKERWKEGRKTGSKCLVGSSCASLAQNIEVAAPIL
jgi:hypothetical protein